jgi:protein-glutamine gamma-glutamyltransferase
MPRGAPTPIPVDRFFELSLLGLVTSGYLAVAGSGYLDLPTLLLMAAALALRALSILGLTRFRISDRAVTVLTLGYIAFFPVDYIFLSPGLLEATVHLVFFLAAVKILTARTPRDHLYTAVISFLELLAGALLSINLNFFLFLALYLFFAVCAFTSGEIRRSLQRTSGAGVALNRRSWPGIPPRLAGLSLITAAGILALTGALFFLLPRTADAAFRHLISQRYHLPGFSNQVTLGQIGEVKNHSKAVMHVRIYDERGREGSNGARRGALQLKWRGNALKHFDGRQWTNPPSRGDLLPSENGVVSLLTPRQRWRPGSRILYRVDLHAIDTDTLFLAGHAEYLNLAQSVIRTGTDSYRLNYVPSETVRYEVSSVIEEEFPRARRIGEPYVPDPLPLRERHEYLQLPPIDPRIAALALETAGSGDAERQARALEEHLRTQYGYTLKLLSSTVPDPLAHFLFERREGHCEYFAAAMTVMLRSLDIPARLVNGFQSGVYNPVSGLYLVRASDAHSWVEAYLPDRGWTSFDPTPPDPNPPAATLWSQVALYFDAADTFWREWVVSYDLGRQILLASRVENSSRRWGRLWISGLNRQSAAWRNDARDWLRAYGWKVAGAVIFALLLLFAAPRLVRSLRLRRGLRRIRGGEASASDATLVYNRMLEILGKRGHSKPAWLTPHEFAASLPDLELAALVARFTAMYNAVRFGARANSTPELSHLLGEVERHGR